MSGMFGKCPKVIVLFGVLSVTAGCGVSPLGGSGESSSDVVTPAANPALTAQPLPTRAPSPPAAAAAAPSRANSYRDAVDRAASATALSQIAQSQDDWRLAASRWQQAIALLGALPASDPNYKAAQAQLPDYRRRLSTAQQQAARSVPGGSSNVFTRPALTPNPSGTASTSTAANPSGSPASASQPAPGSSFRVPIVRRAGGTPVINVTFNGGQQFDMILDTGASGTLVTPAMATALNLTPVGQTRVNTASSRNVTLSLGYVNSIEVGGAIAQNVLVAISGPELSIGLLGQDFFGHYDVTIRQNEVELRAR